MAIQLNHFIRANKANNISNVESKAESVLETICTDIQNTANQGIFYIEKQVTVDDNLVNYIERFFQSLNFYVSIISKEAAVEEGKTTVKYHIDWY